MKVIALVSGGKDSTYNMMQCVRKGHEIVALVNLRPPFQQNELDSFMYQSVGHEIIDLYAEAMELPLYRQEINGKTLNTNLNYEKTKSDEVEDLFEILKYAQENLIEKFNIEIEAVSSGAILSTYQKNRVENVCDRLGVKSLAYLWERDQVELLDEMIESNLSAILIKIACIGLKANEHLGKSIVELRDYLIKLKDKYGVNVCGEGGEYESLTLDCPLFKKRIVLDEYEVVTHSNDAFAPVCFLKLKKFHLQNKS